MNDMIPDDKAIQIGTADMIFAPGMIDSLERFATLMASGRTTIPAHLRTPGDCMAVVMQAAQWRMNPIAVAQKTFMAPGGKLGYEAQLVNAVIHRHAPLQRRIEYEFFGPWEKVIGKFHMQPNRDADKKAYPVADYKPEDEAGIGVRVIGHMRGEDSPRTIDVLLMQCQPRNSTQWATDPQQQITYAATQKWARRYCPDVILGVYSEVDSFADLGPSERDMGDAVVVQPPAPTQSRTDAVKDKVRAKARKAAPDTAAEEPKPDATGDDLVLAAKRKIADTAKALGIGKSNITDYGNRLFGGAWYDDLDILTDLIDRLEECRESGDISAFVGNE